MGLEQQRSQFSVLLFTDVVGSTDLKTRHGTAAYARMLRRHNQLFERLCSSFAGCEILKHTGDGYFATFATASDAVNFALIFQDAMRRETWSPEPLRTRVGIHAGEVAVMTMIGKADVIGLAADMAARVMSLAEGGQILLTRGVFDDARQFIEAHPPVGEAEVPKIRWMAHGPYLFKGGSEPIDVFEVGAEGAAPLRPPPDAEKARRVIPPEQARQLGWRPARGQTIPARPDWRLERRLRAEGAEESWVGRNKVTGEQRSFRFLFDDLKTRTVKEVLTVAPGTREAEGVVDAELDDQVAFVAQALRDYVAGAEQPEWVGRYRVIETIGEGGMGVVYRAEQREPVKREVALKLIKLGMDSKEVLARFEAERQALAMMSHPGIARVLDAGLSEQGRPYFVMEYVAGERITDYCDKHQLTTQARLQLFEQVCDAVQHAHNKGIIHRDIKPSNILVSVRDGKPSPVIIDFGVAKATNQRLTEHSIFTERGQLIGTPEYMSPEQAEMSNLDIDTRSDIYSLGVLLYELLIGALPFEPATLRSAAYAEIQRIIREVDPPRPSTRLSSLENARAQDIARRRRETVADLAAEMRSELEWIPLKAMRKDRTERYKTADQFAEDVRNYLSGQPLLAGPPSAAYKLRKFVQRNRARVIFAGVSAGIALLAVVTAFVLVTRARNLAVAARDYAEQQRNIAVKERQRAEANLTSARDTVGDYLLRVSQNQALRSQALASLRKELLSLASQYYQRFIDDNPDSPELAAALRDSRNQLAVAQQAMGELAAAEKLHRENLAARQKAANERPDDADAQHQLGQSMINYAITLAEMGRVNDAVAQYGAAIVQLTKTAERWPASAPIRSDLAQAHHNLAAMFTDTGKLEDARQSYTQAMKLRQQLVDAEPDSTRYRAELATTQHDLGVLLFEVDPQQAIQLLSAAEATRAALAGGKDASTQRLLELAQTRTWLLDLQAQRDAPAAVIRSAKSAAEAWGALLADRAHLGVDPQMIDALGYRAYAALLAGDAASAERFASAAVALDPDQLWILVNLASAHVLNGEPEKAQAIYVANGERMLPGEVRFSSQARTDLQKLRGLHPSQAARIDDALSKLGD